MQISHFNMQIQPFLHPQQEAKQAIFKSAAASNLERPKIFFAPPHNSPPFFVSHARTSPSKPPQLQTEQNANPNHASDTN